MFKCKQKCLNFKCVGIGISTIFVFCSPCDRPRVIESLRGIEVVDVAAGGAHSACVTAAGDLYTWGKGRYGRLGHSDSEDQLKPKLVRRSWVWRLGPGSSFCSCYSAAVGWGSLCFQVSRYRLITEKHGFLFTEISCPGTYLFLIKEWTSSRHAGACLLPTVQVYLVK